MAGNLLTSLRWPSLAAVGHGLWGALKIRVSAVQLRPRPPTLKAFHSRVLRLESHRAAEARLWRNCASPVAVRPRRHYPATLRNAATLPLAASV